MREHVCVCVCVYLCVYVHVCDSLRERVFVCMGMYENV